MIKYFKNGVLEAETLDLPQDCGEIKVSVTLEEERKDANYYLEFSCPRNVKYISQKLLRIGDGEYEIVLPRGISDYIGEVYVQLILMSVEDATLISRSLIARNPLFVIKESILASNALESSDRRDFFEYAEKIVSNVQDKASEVADLIENIPSQIEDKVSDKMSEVDSAINNFGQVVDDKMAGLKGSVDSNAQGLINVKSEVDSQGQRLESIEDVVENKLDKIAVKNDYIDDINNVYCAGYINQNFGKKVHKGTSQARYTTGSGFAKVASITMPATGTLMVTFSTYFGGSDVKRVGIVNDIKTLRIGIANSVQDVNNVVSATLCTKVNKDDIYGFYVEASSPNVKNTYWYTYALLED